jgi:hypothetical protein
MSERWTLELEHAMACNCNWGCPCSFESPPTYGTCEAALAYRIVNGSHGSTSLDGLLWVTAAAWPGPLHERNGRAIVFLDESADDEQRMALEKIAIGKVGGPIGIFMSTVTRGIEVRTAQIRFVTAGERSTFEVGTEIAVEFEPIRNPVTGDEHHVSTLLHTGMLNRREDHCSAKRFTVDLDGLRFSHPGRNAFTSRVTWSGP